MLQLAIDPDLVIHVTRWPHVGASLMLSLEDLESFGNFLETCLNVEDDASFPREFRRHPITKGAQTRRLEKVLVKKSSQSPSCFELTAGITFIFTRLELEHLHSLFIHLAERLRFRTSSSLFDVISFHRESKDATKVMTVHFSNDKVVALDIHLFGYLVLSLHESCSKAYAVHALELGEKKGFLLLEKDFNSFRVSLQEPHSEDRFYLGNVSGKEMDFLAFYAWIYHHHSLLISEMANNPETTMAIVNEELQQAISQEGHRGSKVRRLQQLHKSLVQRLHQKKPTRRKELQQVFLLQGSLGVELLSRIILRSWQ